MITAVRVQSNDPNRVSVFVDDEFACGLHIDVAGRFGLVAGAPLDPGTAAQALREDEVMRAAQAGMSLLSYRSRTVFELTQRLCRKGFPSEAVDEAVHRLEERGYLDDQGFAREYASSRIESKGEGAHRIRSDLLRKGVDAQVVDRVLSELEPGIDWIDVARAQARRRWERLQHTGDDRRRRKKLQDFLVRKGFDYSTARTVIAELEE